MFYATLKIEIYYLYRVALLILFIDTQHNITISLFLSLNIIYFDGFYWHIIFNDMIKEKQYVLEIIRMTP